MKPKVIKTKCYIVSVKRDDLFNIYVNIVIKTTKKMLLEWQYT